MKIAKLFQGLFGLLMNHTPLIHISSDDHFGSFDWGSNWRISLIAFSLGVDKHYLVTIKSRRLECYRKLTLLSHLKSSDKQRVENAAKRYETMISGVNFGAENDGDSLAKHREYLKERTNDFRVSYANSLSKTNNYVAVSIAYLAFLAFLVKSLLEQELNLESGVHVFALACTAFGGYYFLNVALLLRFALKIKGAVASTFSSIKAKTTEVALTKAVYIDWMSGKNQAEDIVNVVLNIEKYLYNSIVFSMLAWVGLSFTANEDNADTTEILNQAQAIEVVNCEGKVDMGQLSRVVSAFEHQHTASVVYSKDNHVADSVLPFLQLFSAKGSSQVNYEIERLDGGCNSIHVLIKDGK